MTQHSPSTYFCTMSRTTSPCSVAAVPIFSCSRCRQHGRTAQQDKHSSTLVQVVLPCWGALPQQQMICCYDLLHHTSVQHDSKSCIYRALSSNSTGGCKCSRPDSIVPSSLLPPSGSWLHLQPLCQTYPLSLLPSSPSEPAQERISKNQHAIGCIALDKQVVTLAGAVWDAL